MKKKTKLNPSLLSEELKRFKMLNEYDFYDARKKGPDYIEEKDLMLGDKELDEADDEDAKFNDEADKLANQLGVDSNDDSNEEPNDDQNNDQDFQGDGSDENSDDSEGFGGDDSEDSENSLDDFGDADTEDDANTEDDAEEIDVTSLVKGSEEAKAAAEAANNNTQQLMQQLQNLEARLAKMDAVSNKIEQLEKEIVKRNPTPVEKLEMRSLSSYPYSQKLTDYWSDKTGPYDVMDDEQKKKHKEYTLTQDDVNNYTDNEIKKSFSVKNENPFEEEDI